MESHGILTGEKFTNSKMKTVSDKFIVNQHL